MGKEPELKIKVKVDPQINVKETKKSIEGQFKEEGSKLPKVPVELDASKIKENLEKELKGTPISFDPDIQSSDLKQKIEDHFKKENNKPEVSVKLAENNIRDDISQVVESKPFDIDLNANFEKFEKNYKENINRIKQETNLTIDVNVNDFSTELNQKLKEQLKKANSELSYYLKTLTNNSNSLNQVAGSLYIDTDISKRLSDQTNEVRSELEAFKKEMLGFGSLSDVFEPNSFQNFDDFLKKFNAFQLNLRSILDYSHELFDGEFSTDFAKQIFGDIEPEIKTYLAVIDSFTKKLNSNRFLNVNGITTTEADEWLEYLGLFKKTLSSVFKYIEKGEFTQNSLDEKLLNRIKMSDLTNFDKVLTAMEDFNEAVNENQKKMADIEKKVKSRQSKSNDVIGGYDESRIDKINQKYTNVLNHFIDLQEKLNNKKEDTVYFDEILLSNSTEQVSELIRMAKGIDAAYKNISDVVSPEKPEDDDGLKPDEPNPLPSEQKHDQKTAQKTTDSKNVTKDIKNETVPATAIVEPKVNADKDSEKTFTDYTAAINKVIFNIEKETLQNTVDELFKDVVAKIGVAPSENSIKSIKQSIQSELKQLPIDMKATTDGDGDGKTIPLNGSIVVDADHITSPTDPIPLIGKIDVPSANITVDGKAIPDVIIDQKPKKTTSKKKKQVEGQISFDDISTEQLETAAEKAAELMNPISLPGSIRIKKDDVTVNDFKVSIPGKVHLKKDDVVTNNFKVDLPGKVVIKAEDVVTPSTPIDIPVNAVISKKDDAGVIPSLNDEAAQISSLGEGLSEASKKVSDYQENLGAVGTTSQYAAQQMDWLNRALDEQIVDFDKLDEKIKKYLENLEKLNPVELNGRINIAMKDIIVPKKITLNGDLLIANATKEINEAAKKSETEKKKKSISTAKNEGSADSKKEKKEKKEKTPEELQKEYLLSFSGLYKKIMRTMNARDKSAGKLYDGTYVEDLDAFLSGKEFDSYLDDLKDRLKTTIGLLNGVSPDGGWRKDSIYRSAIKDGQHERKNYLYTERDKEDLLAAKKEQEDYLSALKNIPELRSKAFDAATNYGESSELYRLASEKLTAAEQLVASYENSHSEEFLNSISQRTDIKSAQWSEGLVASEKGIVDGIVQNIKKIQTLYNKRNGLFGDKDDDRLRDVNKEISEIVASTQQLIEQADSAGLDVSEIPRIMDSLNTFKAVKDSSDQKEKLSKQAKDDAKQAQKDKQLQNEIEAKKREYLKLLDERNKLLDEQANAAEDGLSQQAKADIAVGLFNKEAELNKVKSFLVNNMAGGDWNDFVKTKVDPKQQAYNRAGERKVNKEIAAEEKKNADDLARKAKEDESYIKKYEQSVGRYLKAKEKLNNANDPAEWYEADNEYKNALENMLGLEDYITGQSSITDNAEYFDRYEKAAYKAVLGENALAEALRKREEVQRAAIARNDEDLKSLNQFIAQVENMQGTLEKNLATDTPNYSSLLSLGNKGKSLFQFLDDNPIDKNLAAQLWGQNAGYDDIKTLEDAFARLRKEAAEAKIPVQEIRTEVEKLTKITRNKTRVTNLSSELNDYLEKFPKVGSSLADEVRELQKALSDPDAWKNAGELGLKMAELQKHAKELGLESENLYDKFKKLFGQHLGTAIVMGALHKMQEATRVIYQNVVNIDTAMAELRKVTNLTSDGYKDFMNTAVEQATKLGVGIDEYINSTADWTRLGYDSKEAENLATYSNLLRNVGDGIDDVNTASSYLISTLQGFKLDSSEVEHVVDVINSVANTQPITAEGIGEVLSRSSAAMSAAGNTLEETIALGVAANAVVQDADSVGKVYADVI